jgi:hypothetical protein
MSPTPAPYGNYFSYGGYPSAAASMPASGPVLPPHSTVPTAPPERDHIYRAALKQQQQDAPDASG